MNFEAVVFDLDGTLLDSLEDIATAANCVLSELGKPTYPIADYRYLVGDGVSVLFQRALPETQDDSSLREACMTKFQEAYSATWHNRSKPYDGIEKLLDALVSAELPLCVLSNKPDAFTKKCVAHFFPNVRFHTVLGHSDRFPRKPDPASALWITQQLGVSASRIAYVGDTNTDMKTAVGAGFFAIGVSWGFRPESELVEHGARVVYHDAAELTRGLLSDHA